MIPNNSSNETNQDSECNLAVNPSDATEIAGSAFTINTSGTNAPVFRSTDGGSTWELANIVPATSGATHDIALAFGTFDNTLYTGILNDGSGAMDLLRTGNLFSNSVMTTLSSRSGEDQPFPTAITTTSPSHADRVFYASNNLSAAQGTKTAVVDQSQNARTASPPAGLSMVNLERRTPSTQDRPSVRIAVHSDGHTYGAYATTKSQSGNKRVCDLTVVRDDNFGTSSPAYSAIITSGTAGVIVQANSNMLFSATAPYLGQQRCPNSISIAVNPNNSSDVWISWNDSVSASQRSIIHVRRSTNGGANWGSDLLAPNNAMNPAIAVNTSGTAGLLYQLLNGTTWETHFQRTSDGGAHWSDIILAKFTDNTPAPTFQPYLGDYTDLVTVGSGFYGTFASGNIPDMANFPSGVIFQRNADFAAHQLRNQANSANVNTSIDPYFFSVTNRFIHICELFPDVCKIKFLIDKFIKIPPYPCLICPWPCLQCPPFEIPFEEIYEEEFKDTRPQTALTIPWFHLSLDNIKDFDIEITTSEGEPVAQEINKTEKGYTISFRPSKRNFNDKEGIHGLKLTATPKTEEAWKKGAQFNFHIEASDYRFKEHAGMK